MTNDPSPPPDHRWLVLVWTDRLGRARASVRNLDTRELVYVADPARVAALLAWLEPDRAELGRS